MFWGIVFLLIIFCVVIGGGINYMIRRLRNRKRAHPFNPKLKNIVINGSNIKYVEKGEGTPIIMIHGSQMNSYDWRDNIDFFAKKHKVYAIDMIGCGWSDKPKGEYSPDFFAEFINDFMNHLNIDKAVFIANSWGGGHTLHFALKYPERINALILSSPCGYKHKLDIMYILRFPIVGRIILLFASKMMVKSQLKAAFFNKSHIDKTLVNAVYFPFLSQGFIQSTLKSYKNADFHFVQNNISKINLPTLLIWGDSDHKHPIEMAEKMNREIKNSQLIVFDDCGHLPHSEKSEQFNYYAEQFIDKILNCSLSEGN